MVSSIQRNDSVGMSKGSYVEAVLKGLRAVDALDVHLIPHETPIDFLPNIDMNNDKTRKKIYVRLLLSIDRRETTAAAMETVSNMETIEVFSVSLIN